MVLRWTSRHQEYGKFSVSFILFTLPPLLFPPLAILWFSDRDQLFTLHWYNEGIMCIVI